MMMGIAISLTGRLLGGAFSPQSLFPNAEPGVWYDPSDLTTMFQDRAGTTLVTTPGQSVGLVLDKRLGLTPGPELTGDPDLNGTGWWTVGPNTTVSGGEAVVVSAPNAATVLERLGLFTVGKTYQIEVTFSEVTAGGFGIFDGSTEFTGIVTAAAQTFTFRSTPSGTTFRLRARGTSSTYKITRVSVREIPGNHMVAVSDAARGTYGVEPFGGRRNLLTFTEQFENAAWSKSEVTVVSSVDVPSQGPTTAFLLRPTTTSTGNHRLTQALSAAGTVTQSAYAKASGYNFFGVTFDNYAAKSVVFNLSTGSVTTAGADATGSIVSVGNGWYRISVTTTLGASSVVWYSLPTDGYTVFAGDGTSGTLIAGAQLELGSTATPYQRVTTAFDVTEAGVPTVHYVQFDGADDGYLTSTITPGTDKAQVFAGVRKLSSGPTGSLFLETSTDSSTNAGALYLLSFSDEKYYFRSGGSSRIQVASEVLSPPVTNVLTGLGDISGDLATLRVNGTQAAQSTANQGTGNYLAYPLYIGRRGGTTLPFNGRLYQMVVRFGPNLDASRIAQVERFINSKTGAY